MRHLLQPRQIVVLQTAGHLSHFAREPGHERRDNLHDLRIVYVAAPNGA
jgi:hypothetical protein